MYFAIHPIYTTCYAETLYLLVIEIFKDKILFDYENGKILINGKEDTITYSLNQPPILLKTIRRPCLVWETFIKGTF